MTIAASTALRLVEFLDHHEFTLFMARDDHLGNALTVLDNKIFLRKIYQQHSNLTAIVSIDGTRCIQHRDAMLKCQSASRTNLSLISFRKSDEKACFYQFAFKRMER